MSYKRMPEEVKQFIRDNYLSLTTSELSKATGFNPSSISNFRKREGLQLPEHIIQERKNGSYIKKGSIPPNKGKRQSEYMSKVQIERTKRTRFKAGSIPHNQQPIGHITQHSEGYLKIKIAMNNHPKSNYEYLSHYVWKKHNGEIPKGLIVAFKDKDIDKLDKDNYKIENLEVITRRENMLRNSIQNYPKEIRVITQLRGALKRQLNKNERSEK